jgi:hypothetical protein
MIAKPMIGKTQEFNIEGLSTSKVLLADNSYVRYGMFGNQIFKGEKIVANIKGTIAGTGTFDELGGFNERAAVVMMREGKGSGVLGVSTIGKPVESVGTKLLSGSADYSKNVLKPSSATLGISKELYAVGDTTIYSYQGTSIGGGKMIKGIGKAYSDFKEDLIAKPSGRMPTITGGSDAGVLVETGKVTISNLMISKPITSLGLGAGFSSISIAKNIPKSFTTTTTIGLTSTKVRAATPIVSVGLVSDVSTKVFPVTKTFQMSKVGTMSVVKPSIISLVAPTVISTPKIKTTPIIDVGQIQTQRADVIPTFRFPSPTINAPFVPPMIPPFFPNFPSGGGSDKVFSKGFGGKRVTRYTPSFSALAWGIKSGKGKKGNKGMSFSGLNFRGIPAGYNLVGGKGMKIGSVNV